MRISLEEREKEKKEGIILLEDETKKRTKQGKKKDNRKRKQIRSCEERKVIKRVREERNENSNENWSNISFHLFI